MLPPVSWIMSLLCVEASSPPWWRRNSSTWQGDVHLQTSQPMPEVAPTKSTKVIEGDWTITTWTEALHYGLLLRELFTRQWWNEESALTTVCIKSHGWRCRTDHPQHFGNLVIKAPWPRGTSRMMMGFRSILVLVPLKPRTTSSSRSTANALLSSSLAKLLSCVSLMWSTPLFHCFSCNTSQRMVLLPTSWFPQMRIGRGSSKSNNWCISSCHSA